MIVIALLLALTPLARHTHKAYLGSGVLFIQYNVECMLDFFIIFIVPPSVIEGT